jgi:hypothetical protein
MAPQAIRLRSGDSTTLRLLRLYPPRSENVKYPAGPRIAAHGNLTVEEGLPYRASVRSSYNGRQSTSLMSQLWERRVADRASVQADHGDGLLQQRVIPAPPH